ncbi:MAG TPA: hypothetical protein VM933_04685 [Acidimicrobiales bacterium]|nr:hypothetical protein [Acidimicrobiales bacterium]
MSDTAAGSETGSPDDPVPGEGDPAAVGTKGGGEWPSPSGAAPTGAAPGSDPERAAELRAQRKERTTSGDGTAAGELHPPTRLPSAYAQDPEQAATSTTPDGEDDEVARDAGAARDRGPADPGTPTTEQT